MARGGVAVPTWTLQDRLRKARETKGLSQEELAARVGISPRTVSRYESGAVAPHRVFVRAWGEVCDVDPDWLLTGLQPAKSTHLRRRRTAQSKVQRQSGPQKPGEDPGDDPQLDSTTTTEEPARPGRKAA